ncbi:MAG: hypothetical protein U9Q82_06775, partial [Chloroflexota bacterium]|nr:hypothetical protein [Chloroflexota bacterium]
MKKRRYNGLLVLSLSLLSAMLACSVFSGSVEPTIALPPEATSTTAPPPTQAPVEPTKQPEPTEAPTETEVVEEEATQPLVPEGELGIYAIHWYQDAYDYWYV